MNRLFSIVQVLRAAKKPVKAKELAEQLEVSVRTIYRDIAELQMQNVPIVGEAGIGYILKNGFDLPPLMLTAEELEAALLGVQWLAQCGDKALAKSAGSLTAKIEAAIPEHLRHVFLASPGVVPATASAVADTIDMAALRTAIRDRKKIAIVYTDGNTCSARVIWPFIIAYFETVRVVAAWCELRGAFRHFRTDRIATFDILPDTYPKPISLLKAEWWETEQYRTDYNRPF
ncbi:YafY family transcriptional regulator [Methylovulum psychrotolerans]|uniref:helix-turn-helix transcriptional regulator n=1 Tax=Methylovulum psychrotolerans TaxID=1704499 RepID=UPI001BFF4B80|nr:YafY family protein [Methylovulum psychrotolerans]MBT9097324.1 YafY family transcriptional regulator [Methylovulum psychrotolerans]